LGHSCVDRLRPSGQEFTILLIASASPRPWLAGTRVFREGVCQIDMGGAISCFPFHSPVVTASMPWKPKQCNRSKPCYYCGARSTSGEHAPPDLMFRGIRPRSSITVPSCDQHNSLKSRRDQAIVPGLLRSVEEGASRGIINRPLAEPVRRLIGRMEEPFRRSNKAVSLRPLIVDPPPGLAVDMPYFHPGVDVLGWAVELTAALVWSATGYWDPESDWDKAWRWSPCYFPMRAPCTLNEAGRRVLANMDIESVIKAEADWRSGWSAHPHPYPEELYRFEVSFHEVILFRHVFFDCLRIYVGFETSERTHDLLKAAVGANDEAEQEAGRS
jgi:hypothetical protein